MTKTDRRVRRTRELLQQSLIALVGERRYEAITIRDIADRANVGRTTFYLHYRSKDDLFMDCHEAVVGAFHFGPRYPLSREELLAPEASPGMAAAYRHLAEARVPLARLFHGQDSPLLLRRMRDWRARDIEASLRAAFAEGDSTIPLVVLANALAGAHIGLVHWWLEQRQPCAPETLAQAFHRLQRAALRDAFGLPSA